MTTAATAAAADAETTSAPNLHAYHRNLPPYCIDPSDGRSYLSKYAEGKADDLVRLVNSIDLSAIDWNAWRKGSNGGGGDRDVSYAESDDEDILEEECFAAGFGGGAEEDDDAPSPHMATIVKKCARLNVQLSTVLSLKHYTLSQRDLCRILLKVLTLLCATLETTTAAGDVSVVLRVDEVGFLLERVSLRNVSDVGEQDAGTATTMTTDGGSVGDVRVKECKSTTADGARAVDPDFASSEFALPTPARDSLLSAAIALLSKSKKALLLQASHLALPPYELEEEEAGSSASSPGGQQQTPLTLVLHWRVLLAMLLRTAPEFALDPGCSSGMGDIGSTMGSTRPPTSSHSRHSSALRKTVSVVRASRHFFDQQGLALARPLLEGGVSAVDASELPLADTAAREVWSTVRSDLLFRTHTNACFRGLIVLYLFLPSRCSEVFYSEVLPEWQKSWSSIDRCNDFDCLWLHLFCRARKYASRRGCFDWGPLRKKVLSNCGYWLQIPMGGASDDRAFPRAAPLRSRGVPGILKAVVGSSSAYQEGLDFVEKLASLLVFCVGRDEESDCATAAAADGNGAENSSAPISQGTADIIRFLAFVAPYFNPSNTGPWTFPLGTVLHYISYEFSHRIATEWGQAALAKSYPTVASSTIRQDPYFDGAVPHNEIVAVLDSLLPLCQQAVYSKNSYVGRAGESALLSLAQIAPQIVSPPFLDFAARALDVSSINMSHQAPSALSLLQHLVQTSVRRRPSILLERLPDILSLSLAGIDCNDQRKTVSTLSLYHSIVAWLPVGGVRSRPKRSIAEISASDTTFLCSGGGDGTIRLGNNLIDSLSTLENSTVFADALSKVPESSLIYRPDFALDKYNPSTNSAIQDDEQIEDACLSMSEWSLSFLDRVYGLLRAAAKTEKVAKAGVGVASRHSSVDAQQTRMFARYLRSCLRQIFASMDKRTHERALQSVCDFVSSETLPFAAKDAASLCEAAAMGATGLDALVPLLTSGLERESSKTVIYRLRCLSGAVRHAGPAVLSHRSSIISVLEFALSERDGAHDKHVFKIGCKLLRHTLASQVEAYPLPEDGSPRVNDPLGKSAHLHGDNVKWNSPTGEQIDFAVELLERFALVRIRELVADGAETDTDFSGADFINLKLSEMDVDVDNGDNDISDTKERGVDVQSETAASATSSGTGSTSKKNAIKRDEVRKRLIQKWRRSLKALKYSLRGIVGILLDDDNPDTNSLKDLHPHEMSVNNLLSTASSDTRKCLLGLRGKLCVLLSSMMSMIAHETCDAESKVRPDISDKSSYAAAISSDTKICIELTEVALLLLTRRGAFGHVAQDKGAFQSLKEMSKNQVLSCQASHIWCALQRAQVYGEKEAFLYKDGEDGGKCLPRRLLITRVWLFHREVQHSASFDIPRRLRKRWMGRQVSSEGNKAAIAESKGFFSADLTYSQVQGEIEMYLDVESAAGMVDSLKAYEGVVDGLIALTCHTNVEVRGCALGVLDSSLSRFGWFIRDRVPRLLLAIDLADDELRGDFGVPSCYQLSKQVDIDGKRKRLAEVIKGVCAIVANSRTMKHILATESSRYQLIKTLSSTQQLLSVLPTEEHLKVLHFLQVIFSRFRSRWHSLPRYKAIECQEHLDCLLFLLEKLVSSEKLNQAGNEGRNQQNEGTDSYLEPEIGALSSASSESVSNDITMMHWRNQLLVCWFLTHLIESRDLMDEALAERIGKTCFYLLQNEMGQPLQRAALGLLGRSITFVEINKAKQPQQSSDFRGLIGVKEKLCEEDFCHTFALALVFNHKADTQVGGGHRAQWSAGVEEVLKDASVNCAPRQLYPFQRGGMHCSTFKVQHARMLQSLLLQIDANSALISASYFLKHAEVLSVAPPNEDQRNKQCTAWEIYAGVSRALLLHSSCDEYRNKVWKMVLSFFDKVLPSTPIDMTRAAHDSIRYSIHSMRAGDFYLLTDWIIGRIEESLWQHSSDTAKDGVAAADAEVGQCISSEAVDNLETNTNGSEGSKEASDNSTSQAGLDGFASQSKWLYLICAILVEMDCCASPSNPWFVYDVGVGESQSIDILEESMLEFKQSFYETVCKRLLPMLLRATGHPYDKCRDHIASCLFRICACHSRFLSSLNLWPDAVRQRSTISAVSCEPGKEIIQILSTRGVEEHAFKEKLHALITTRKFLAHFVHLGDGKQDFSNYVVPLLPLAFSALKVSEEGDADISASDRALEAEVAKSFRYSLAEISSSCLISYVDGSEDIVRVLDSVDEVSTSATWQIRQAAAHFLRCFQGCHKIIFSKEQTEKSTNIVARLLADDRREVSSAAIAALTGILAVTEIESVERLVAAQVETAKATIKKKKKKSKAAVSTNGVVTEKEILRSRQQQSSVFFLCAAVLARPYDTPPFVPVALAALSMHSFEHRAPLAVRETVKKCFAEFKRTHMNDNWELHRKRFTQEQLEALDDVVSTPHYYA